MDKSHAVERELRDFQAELDPILGSVILGVLPESYEVSVPEESAIRELRGTCKLLIDGFFEQWTELLSIQEQLIQRNKEYLDVISRLETFTYTASHDLRSQVVNLVMLSDLKERNPKPAISDRIEVDLKKSIDRLSNQLDDLISKVSGSNAPIVKRPLELPSLFEELSKDLEYKDVSNMLITSDPKDIVIVNDWNHFKKLFTILLENSRQHLTESVEIKVHLSRENTDPNTWVIDYTDAKLINEKSGFGDVIADQMEKIGDVINVKIKFIERAEGNYYKITGGNE